MKQEEAVCSKVCSWAMRMFYEIQRKLLPEILFLKQQWAALTAGEVEQKFWFFIALLLEDSLKWIANGKKNLP